MGVSAHHTAKKLNSMCQQCIHTWMIGSSEPVHFDAEEVLRRLKEPAIRAYVEAAGESTEEIAKLLRSKPVKLWTPGEGRSTDVNTDLFPKTEFYLNRTKVDLF